MEKEKIYLASADIAERARCIESSYRTKDGRFIIHEKSLRDFTFRMTAEEYVTGLDVTMVTEEEAKRLIAEGGYAIGPLIEEPESQEPETPSDAPEEQESLEDEAPSETPEEQEDPEEEVPNTPEGSEGDQQSSGEVEENEDTDNNDEEE